MDLETGKSTNLGNDSSNALVKEKLQWLEPIQRVQSIAESGIKTLPSVYIKPETERPQAGNIISFDKDILVINMSGLKLVIISGNPSKAILNYGESSRNI